MLSLLSTATLSEIGISFSLKMRKLKLREDEKSSSFIRLLNIAAIYFKSRSDEVP